MANTNPARGMRDFLPSDVRKREYVIGIVKEVYESYGFEPLETPAVENLETLTGKYGEEGNQLIYKILKRGEKLEQSSEKESSDLALRYDLTVPLARVVANRRNDLPKFFKRYQIQPVWRADRPARGRFREFYQCDVDAIGSSSMIVESELISAVCEILKKLGFKDFIIRINHREVLRGILNAAGVPIERHSDALIALDKIDKIGREGVEKELKEKGVSNEVGNKLLTFFEFFIKNKSKNIIDGNQQIKIAKFLKIAIETEEEIENLFSEYLESSAAFDEIIKKAGFDSPQEYKVTTKNLSYLFKIGEFIKEGLEKRGGIYDLGEILGLLMKVSLNSHIKIDPSLARGLSYYTGAIFEINVPDLAGSLGGGGRYDGLIGMFGKEQIPACGFSLGLERILVVMEERGMFQKLVDEGKLKLDSADVMIASFDETLIDECLKLADDLRKSGLRTLVFPEANQKIKPLKYAEQINVPFVCLMKEAELAENKITLKNMRTGEQETVLRKDVAGKMKESSVENK